jgi:hypothetical protein
MLDNRILCKRARLKVVELALLVGGDACSAAYMKGRRVDRYVLCCNKNFTYICYIGGYSLSIYIHAQRALPGYRIHLKSILLTKWITILETLALHGLNSP